MSKVEKSAAHAVDQKHCLTHAYRQELHLRVLSSFLNNKKK